MSDSAEIDAKLATMSDWRGAALGDPEGLFNSSLDGNTRRAIDIREGEEIDGAAFKSLVAEAVAVNLAKKKA